MALWLGAHLAGSCLLWLVASALAPSYVRVSFLRTFAAAVIMGGLAIVSLYLLNPQLGGWRLLIEFGTSFTKGSKPYEPARVREDRGVSS